MSDIQQAIDAVEKAVHDMKASNEEALSEKADKGYVDSLLQSKLEAANEDVTKQIDALQAHYDEIEKKMNRKGLNGGSPEQEEKHAQAFSEHLSVANGRQITVDVEQFQAYKQGFDQYIRGGADSMGSEMRAAMSVGSDKNGGYYVTPDLSGRIATLVYETSPVRQVASVQIISTDALEGDRDLDEANTGWVGETEARPETATPEIGEYRIPMHEQYANPKATQKLLDDSSVNIETWLAGKVSDKLSRTENTAFVSGDGVKKPRGFLTYPHGVPTASAFNVIEQTPSGAAGAFDATDPGDALIDMQMTLKSEYMNNAAWGMRRTTFAEVRKLKDGQGNYLWERSFQESGIGITLLGHPVVFMEDMPAIAADSLSIVFGNFAQGYQIIDHAVGLRVLRDPFTDKPFVRFYTTKRVGGDVVNFEAIKLMKFATSV